MEKFLWNVGGLFLFLLNIWCLMAVFVSSNWIWGVALVALAVSDWIYKEKRPTWMEV